MIFLFPSTTEDRCLTIMLYMVALLLGWALGILVAPYDDKEKKQFDAFYKVLSIFISGFVVARADKLIEQIFDPKTLTDPLAKFRLALFASGFLLALITTFVFRKYAE